jgi:hypothetical protein
MKIVAAIVVSMMTATPVPAQEDMPPRAEQVRLALSAAAPQIRDAAGVLVLGGAGYQTERPSSNGFWCLLERWKRAVVTPICYDDVGSESTLLVVKYLETRRAAGAADSVIYAEIDAGYEAGRFQAPARWGVAYMLSPFGPPPPHVMYYAPHARNDDFGGAKGSARGLLPFIYDEGTPRAYIVQLVDRAAWEKLDPVAHHHSAAPAGDARR